MQLQIVFVNMCGLCCLMPHVNCNVHGAEITCQAPDWTLDGKREVLSPHTSFQLYHQLYQSKVWDKLEKLTHTSTWMWRNSNF